MKIEWKVSSGPRAVNYDLVVDNQLVGGFLRNKAWYMEKYGVPEFEFGWDAFNELRFVPEIKNLNDAMAYTLALFRLEN